MGGGVLAGDLFDTNVRLGDRGALRVLVIEKGGITFHSHSLNAARPSGLDQDRGQQNDTFFARFREDYKVVDSPSWLGGPMHSLGGRTAAWGLFTPRIHEANLRKYFPGSVCDDLLGSFYRRAETLMDVSLPMTLPVHRDLMEQLNNRSSIRRTASPGPLDVQWQWGRIASEFGRANNFEFSSGAYSTIDKLLEIAMSMPLGAVQPAEQPAEHKHFKILLEVEVRSLIWSDSEPTRAVGVHVRTLHGDSAIIRLSDNGRVVLSAGSVATPAILLRSQVDLAARGGLHLTDHEIRHKALPFRYRNPQARHYVGSVKLQTYVRPMNRDCGPDEIVLANMSIDASSFLPRSTVSYDFAPRWILAVVRSAELDPQNIIYLEEDEPVVRIRTTKPPITNDAMLDAVAGDIIEVMKDVLNIEFLEAENEPLKTLELGAVAHELGTVPMGRPEAGPGTYCLNEDLDLVGYSGVYVCDLSLFPFSPEVNPSLTLAALALRLSRHLLRRADASTLPDHVRVVNHSGLRVQVWVAADGVLDGRIMQRKELLPGEEYAVRRDQKARYPVLVFRVRRKVGDEYQYAEEPEVLLATVGEPAIVRPLNSRELESQRRPHPDTMSRSQHESI